MFLDDTESSIHIALQCKRKKEGDVNTGWWGNELLGFEIGSKLYFLDRSTLTSDNIGQRRAYTEEALRELFDDFSVECKKEGQCVKTKITVKDRVINA